MSVTVTRTLPPNSIEGSFSLSLDGYSYTPPIQYDASEEMMAEALQNLTAVGAVRVARAGPSLDGGYTWSVTFLQLASGLSGNDIPLLMANSSGLVNSCASCGFTPNVSIATIQQGFGLPEIHRFRSSCRHVNQVYQINLVAKQVVSVTNQVHGFFTLGLDLRSVERLEGRGQYAATLPVYLGTVAMIKDEAYGPYPTHGLVAGAGPNESMERRMYSLSNWEQVREETHPMFRHLYP